MENASKALLIAVAVLIVIILIAFGMKILNSPGDVSGDAESVGERNIKQNRFNDTKYNWTFQNCNNDEGRSG